MTFRSARFILGYWFVASVGERGAIKARQGLALAYIRQSRGSEETLGKTS